MEMKAVKSVSKEQAKATAMRVVEKTLSCRVLNLRYLGGGSFGFVWCAEIDKAPHTVVVKACRTEGMCLREAQDLKILRAHCPIPVPQVYFTALADADTPLDFIGMEHMHGSDCFTTFSFLLLSDTKKMAFAEELTAAMHALHSVTNDRFGLVGDPQYADWFSFYKPFAADILDTARKLCAEKKLESRVVTAMERAWDAFDFIFSEPVPAASLIHGDLNVMNVLADKNLKPTAIIDPLESRWADKEYDLFQLRNLTGDRFSLYETYKKNYPVSEKVDLKTAFYGLYHEVYAYISSGTKVNLILMPLIRRMHQELKKAGY